MNETQKEKAKEAHGRLTGWLCGLGVPANWAKVGAGILLGASIGALATCQPSCSRVTPEQVQAAHGLYHAVTGKPCKSTIYKANENTKVEFRHTK